MLEKYGPDTSYYLSVYAMENTSKESAAEFLLHASEAVDSPVRSFAKQEYLDFLLEEKDIRKLRGQYRRYNAEGGLKPGYTLTYGLGLLRSQRYRELQRLVGDDLPHMAGMTGGQQAVYDFLRMYADFSRSEPAWMQSFLRLCSDYRPGLLPDELFTADVFEDADTIWSYVRDEDDFRTGERALLLGKYAYRSRRYITAYRRYSEFLRQCAEDPSLFDYCTGQIMDEFALSALYSGNVIGALGTAEAVLGVLNTAPEGEDFERSSSRFWLHETIGYLERKLGRFRDAFDSYTTALGSAPFEEKERIRWYIFDSLVRINYIEAVDQLSIYSAEWADHEYYNDVLFDLIDGLLRHERWDLVARMADTLKEGISCTATARAAYIAARAAESGLIESDEMRITEWLQAAVENARGAGSGLYYRFMASARLRNYGVVPDVLNPGTFFQTVSGESRSWGKSDEQILLQGFLRFGLPLEAYDRFGRDEWFIGGMSDTLIRDWCSMLQRSGKYLESIRLFNTYSGLRETILNDEDIRMLYPRPYSEMIDQLTEEYGLPDYLLYALVREESLFDADITSAAGAVGLSQLMPATARDVASRMRIEADDLTDPSVNLRLGAWYLDHLISRTDNFSQALFAYNGGITRVRRWVGSYAQVPGDLLLEKVPYEETAHYGRKVLVSSILYGYFYSGSDPEGIIRDFFDL